MEASEFGSDLQKFKDFQPTQFDMKGMGSEGQEDWVVLPTTITRDSDVLSESNFETAKKLLDYAGVDYEVHRFGHWGPGWFEIIVVEPTEKGLTQAGEIACALENYPVLDSQDFGEREHEAQDENWENWGRDDALRHLTKLFGLEPDTHDFLDEHEDILDSLYHEGTITFYGEADLYLGGLDNMSRNTLAGLIRKARRENKDE